MVKIFDIQKLAMMERLEKFGSIKILEVHPTCFVVQTDGGNDGISKPITKRKRPYRNPFYKD